MGSSCLEFGCCWLCVGFWVLEEVGVQGEVIKFVLLAGPTLCLGAGNFFTVCICQQGFCIAQWDLKLSWASEKGLSAIWHWRAEIKKTPLWLLKQERHLLLGYQNEAFRTCHWLFSDVSQTRICPHFMPRVPHLWNKDKVFLSPSLPYCAAVEENLVDTGLDLVF